MVPSYLVVSVCHTRSIFIHLFCCRALKEWYTTNKIWIMVKLGVQTARRRRSWALILVPSREKRSIVRQFSLSLVCQLPHANRSTPPLILCFHVNLSPLIVRNTFSTLSFRSACRITILLVLLDKGVQTINQPIQILQGFQAIGSKFWIKATRKPGFP